MTSAISVTGLTRQYRGHLALDQVSLDVEAGSIIGLLGRNGAGKTTLLRILAGQEFPSAEPYAGLDAVARQTFYDRLLAEYAEHPRTILLSTHLIDEAAGLLERVIVIDHGRVVLKAGADDLRGVATAVTGPVLAVEEFTAGRVVWDRRRIASQASAVVVGALDEADRARARSLHLDLSPLTLQQLVVHAAAQPAGTLERTSA
jgi:ABC-2 type transport system ATP-binding protein